MLSFFPRDVLGEIWDLIWSVSEGFMPTFVQMMSLTFGLFIMVGGSGLHGTPVYFSIGLKTFLIQFRNT